MIIWWGSESFEAWLVLNLRLKMQVHKTSLSDGDGDFFPHKEITARTCGAMWWTECWNAGHASCLCSELLLCCYSCLCLVSLQTLSNPDLWSWREAAYMSGGLTGTNKHEVSLCTKLCSPAVDLSSLLCSVCFDYGAHLIKNRHQLWAEQSNYTSDRFYIWVIKESYSSVYSTLLDSTLLSSLQLYSFLLYIILLFSILHYSTLFYCTLFYFNLLYSPLLNSNVLYYVPPGRTL